MAGGFETTFFVTLRESLEAFLIVSILTGLVVKLGRPAAKRPLLWGALTAFVVSIVVGLIVNAFVLDLFEASVAEPLVAGVASLIAVAILTYMVVWMYKHTLGLVDELRQRAKGAIEAGGPLVFFMLAFVAVAREGLETVLIVASQSTTTSGTLLLIAVLGAILASAVTAWLLFSGIVRLNIQKFFATSGILLIFFAAGLLAAAVHEFADIGLLPKTAQAWDTAWLLSDESTIGSFVNAILGYRAQPSVLEAASYITYLLALGAWYLRGLVHMGRHGRPVVADA